MRPGREDTTAVLTANVQGRVAKDDLEVVFLTGPQGRLIISALSQQFHQSLVSFIQALLWFVHLSTLNIHCVSRIYLIGYL